MLDLTSAKPLLRLNNTPNSIQSPLTLLTTWLPPVCVSTKTIIILTMTIIIDISTIKTDFVFPQPALYQHKAHSNW